MFKKLGIPVVALLAALTVMNPTPAKAGVHFGFGIYAAPPVYQAPVYPDYYYANPYSYNYDYAYPGYYGGYYGPTYYGHRDWDDHRGYYRDHDRGEHRGYEGRGREGYGHRR